MKPKTTADDVEEFKRRWNSHVDDIQRLGMSLPPEKISEMREVQEDLRELVEAAAENVEE